MEFLVGGFSGLVEVAVTHPFDSYKTHAQVKSDLRWRPYAGVVPRLVGVVPMRVVFWGSFGTLMHHDVHPVTAGALTGALQTLVDAPIENAKMTRMFDVTTSLYRGFLPHCARNVGFAACMGACFPYDLGALGAALGVVATHPLDTWKTAAQSGLPPRPVWSGLGPRLLQSVVAMGIGQGVYRMAHD